MNQITTVGVDLAKAVIVVCAADAEGRALFFKQLSFNGFGQWAATLSPCTFGMEACSSAHHWGRRLAAYGHTVRLIAAEFVKPFRKSQGAKNDRNDAQAILTAVRQPDMRFVSVKSVDQQAVLAWHCMRRGWSDDRTALISRVRGLLAEFGVWLAQSPEALKRALPRLLEDERVPARMRALLSVAHEELRRLEGRIEHCEMEIRAHAQQSEDAQRIEAIIGVGAITSSAVAATVTHARDFKERSPNGGMARTGTKAVQLGWQNLARQDYQAWGHVPAWIADRRSTLSAVGRLAKGTGEAHPTAALDG
jgi:transposase